MIFAFLAQHTLLTLFTLLKFPHSMQGCQRSSTLISVIVYGTNRLHTPKPDILWNGYHFEKAVWCGDALRCQWWESGLVWYVCEVIVQSAFESVNWNMSGISDTNGEKIPHPHWLVSERVCFGISDPCCSISCDINRFDSPASSWIPSWVETKGRDQSLNGFP